jgi:hypothetical protein
LRAFVLYLAVIALGLAIFVVARAILDAWQPSDAAFRARRERLLSMIEFDNHGMAGAMVARLHHAGRPARRLLTTPQFGSR